MRSRKGWKFARSYDDGDTEVDLGCSWELHGNSGCQCLSCRLSDGVFSERLVAAFGFEAVEVGS